MAKVREKDAPNSGSAKFGRTSSRNKQKMTIGGCFDRLPCEILHNIALMLPFSSIIQLKCSSKFWYKLLTDQKFVDLHLTRALQKPPGYLFTTYPKFLDLHFTHPLLKPPGYLVTTNPEDFVEESGGHVSTSKLFKYSFDYFESKRWARFQSSGGLMCAYSSQSYCFRVFNPHIAEEIQVPHDHKSKRWYFQHFIFSYSPSIKKYKILKLGEIYDGPAAAEICTLGSNIWREIQNVPSWDIDGYIQCQGDPFWMKKSDLHFFDLVSETFHVIPGPPVLDHVHVTDDGNTCYNFMRGNLISMGHTVGYVHNYRLWVLENKTKGIWINRYDFLIPPSYRRARLIGTSENGHLFGYINFLSNFFSHDMGCKGFKVLETKLNEHGSEEESRIGILDEYMGPHLRSLVSPVRIMEMEKMLEHKRKRKRVLDTLKLDYDATDDDLVNKMYEFLEAYEKDVKAKTHKKGARYSNSRKFRKF